MNKGEKNTESVIIKSISHLPNGGVVLHTTKCKNAKTKEGSPVERFKFTDKQFANFVKASGKPAFIYEKQIIGGTYNLTTQWVEEGDAFLQGEGTYKTAHPARVSESIVMSALAVAQDTRIAEQAYYAHLVGAQTSPVEVSAPVAVIADENENLPA